MVVEDVQAELVDRMSLDDSGVAAGDVFPTAAHLASWAKFSPGAKEPAGRSLGNGSTGHGNRYVARVLGEAAVGASQTDTFLG